MVTTSKSPREAHGLDMIILGSQDQILIFWASFMMTNRSSDTGYCAVASKHVDEWQDNSNQ
jgi:hypothetical protein